MNYTLYKIDNNNNIVTYKIDKCDGGYNITWGRVNGQQQTKFVKVEPKNITKVNETTVDTQTELEMAALAKKMQKEKGYTTNTFVLSTQYVFRINDKSVMLAQKYNRKYIKLPLYVQPKLDGVRAYFDGKELSSRLHTAILTTPHITEAIIDSELSEYKLDGELMLPGCSFQELVSIIKKKSWSESNNKIVYNVFDYMDNNLNFSERYEVLKDIFSRNKFNGIELVPAYKCNDETDIDKHHLQFVTNKFEGTIVRNDTPYENKRSYNLLKLKDFIDEEFMIIGQHTDNNGECVFSCACRDNLNQSFKVKMIGTHEERVELLNNNNYGKALTVKYIRKTDDGIPFHAVGVAIRDYE